MATEKNDVVTESLAFARSQKEEVQRCEIQLEKLRKEARSISKAIVDHRTKIQLAMERALGI